MNAHRREIDRERLQVVLAGAAHPDLLMPAALATPFAGGAIGLGSAANAGYHGRPGTLTVAVKVSHAVPITLAITLEYLSSIGVDLGADARISGVHGGPTICPTDAVTALITTPTIVAAVCHWLHAEQIADDTPSMKLPILPMCIFWVSVWYLFSDAGWNSGGMPGLDAFSSGLNARPY